MINYVLSEGKTKPDIFLASGNLSLCRNIREKIDTGIPLDHASDDVFTVAFVLMDFLQSLLTPILPIHILDEIVMLYESEGDKVNSIMQQLLFKLPKDNSTTLVYLISFFREMLSCSGKNKLTPEKISEILCECLVGEEKLGRRKAGRKVKNDDANGAGDGNLV